VDEMIALAAQQLERVKVLCSQIGLTYVDLPPFFMGCGIAIGFGETDYTILSILAGGSESQLMATSGLLRDIHKDRGAALLAVNRFNQQNSSYTVYLHDAEAGWSLLVQRTTPIEVFLDSPSYLSGLVRGLPSAVGEMREQIAQETALGGRPWRWEPQDHNDLLIRSLL
jgi:hypothetical protein